MRWLTPARSAAAARRSVGRLEHSHEAGRLNAAQRWSVGPFGYLSSVTGNCSSSSCCSAAAVTATLKRSSAEVSVHYRNYANPRLCFCAIQTQPLYPSKSRIIDRGRCRRGGPVFSVYPRVNLSSTCHVSGKTLLVVTFNLVSCFFLSAFRCILFLTVTNYFTLHVCSKGLKKDTFNVQHTIGLSKTYIFIKLKNMNDYDDNGSHENDNSISCYKKWT